MTVVAIATTINTEVLDDGPWFTDHPRRLFRARASNGGIWLIRRRPQGAGAASMRSRHIWRKLTAPTSGLPCRSSPLRPLRASTAASAARE